MNIKKLIFIGSLFISVVAVLIVVGRLSIKGTITKNVSKIFGLPAEIGGFESGYLLKLKDIKIKNPKGFKDDTMLDISNMTIDKNLGLMEIHVKELLVERSPTGRVNIDYLSPDASAFGDLKVKKFNMHLDKVTFKDSKTGKTTTCDVNINKQYSNLPNPGTAATIIVSQGVGDTPLPKDEGINPPNPPADVPPGTDIPPQPPDNGNNPGINPDNIPTIPSDDNNPPSGNRPGWTGGCH